MARNAIASGFQALAALSSAAGAVFAHGFVDERIEFAARQRYIIAAVFSAVTSDGQFRSTARRRRHEISGASRHELGDFAAGKQSRAAGYGAMVGKKERVVVRHKRFDSIAQLLSSRRGILHQGNLSKSHDDFGKQGMIQRASRDRKSGGGGRMAVADSHHIRPHTVEEEMHGQFGGKFAVSGELPAEQIGDDQIVGRELSFIHASRSGENTAVSQPNGNVSFASDDVSAFVHPSSSNADLETVLFFALRVA